MRSGPTPIFFLVIVGFIFTFAIFILLTPQDAAGEDAPELPLTMGDLALENATETIKDTTVILNGNITVGNGGRLVLENCDLQVNSTNVSRLSIMVLEGGTLDMTNSSVTRNGSYGYTMEIEANGSLSMENCTISWMNNAYGMDESGMRIRSDDVTITNSSIVNAGVIANAITINGSSPRITNSVLSGQYSAAYLVNLASPEFHNTSFFSDYYVGVGLLCINSSFLVQDCNFSANYFGIDIRSGVEGLIRNTSFWQNRIAIILSEGSGMIPDISSCHFEENEWCAVYLFGSASMENCTFLGNGAPSSHGPVAAIILIETDPHSSVLLANCFFQGNHNGIISGNISLQVEGCTFENNTLNGGTSGILLYGPDIESRIRITGSEFTGGARGIGVFEGSDDADIVISNNTVWRTKSGILSWNSTLDIQANDFSDTDVAVEDHHRESSILSDNTYVNVTVRHRFIVRITIRVNDTYGINLSGADLSIAPGIDREDYPLQIKTDGRGLAEVDVIWSETVNTSTDYHPYTISVQFQGVEDSFEIDDLGSLEHSITLNFLRPDLEVSDLKVKSHGFSILSDRVRENEESEISFTVKNVGEGLANGSTVTVRADTLTIFEEQITLIPGDSKDFTFSWKPRTEGKINISVEVTDHNESNVSENSLATIVNVGADQRGYYYLCVVLTVLVLSALIWWMAGNIEGADEDMAEFSRKIKMKLAALFGSWSRRLSSGEDGALDTRYPFIPGGDLYSWDGEPALSGSGKYAPWSIEDENLLRARKKDVITVQIKIPLPEPEVVEEGPEMEVFEWMTERGQKESIKVDKRTLNKIRHPKMFICSLCDRNFVSVDTSVKCPWCGGKAYFLQDM